MRQLIRDEPLETTMVEVRGLKLTLPSPAEMLRIKAVLILERNATRDYLDFVALADVLCHSGLAQALRSFDRLYPQPSGESALQQLQVQLAHPLPFDLDRMKLAEYKHLDPRWHDWDAVKAACADAAVVIFDQVIGVDRG